jgi:hypothetical protein
VSDTPPGSLVCLSSEVVESGACWGGYSWSQLLFHGSMIVVICSLFCCGWFRCLGCLEGACLILLSIFSIDLFVVLNFACHVSCLTYCMLVFGGPVHLASRSGVGV